MSKHTPRNLTHALVRKSNSPPMQSETLVGGSLALLLASALVGALAGDEKTSIGRTAPSASATDLRRGAGLLAASVLLDSALEHFRGNYENRAMFVAPVTSALTLAAALAGPRLRAARAAIFGIATLIGVTGMAFHFYNVWKRPGRFSWNNLFYGAPLGAPGGLALAGAMGMSGMALDGHGPAWLRNRLRSGRLLSFATAISLVITSAEAWLLHFRGSFHDPAMYAPVTLPPVTATALAVAATAPTAQRISFARLLVWINSMMGLAGCGFHILGVHRNMGGWHNWKQMLFQGPPVPAPPSFAAIGLAGLAALRLVESTRSRVSRHV